MYELIFKYLSLNTTITNGITHNFNNNQWSGLLIKRLNNTILDMMNIYNFVNLSHM